MSGPRARETARLRPPVSTGLRLDARLYAVLVVSFAGIGATGLAWTIISDVLALDVEGLGHLMGQLHGAFVIPAAGVAGALLSQHARTGWRLRRNRASGLITAILALLLGGTAWGLYYASEAWHGAMVWTHIAGGLAALGLVPLHVMLGRRRAPAGS